MREGLKFFMPLAAVFMMAACGDDTNGVDPQPDPQPEPPVVSAAHAVAVMDITTENGAPIKGKEKEDYVNCTITVDHPDDQWDYTGTGRIRGRGNSTWEWYDKKPYRIKLDEKASIVGLAAEKDWVLLANFRDPTHMMNTFVFELGHVMGMPYTNHSRYMEVTLNGEYIGLYQLTEQIEQGKNRVAVDDVEGVLIALDVGGDGACAHVGAVAQNAVAHVVVMRGLHAVKEDHVFQFHGIAHHAARAYQCAAADERAVPHLGFRTDDARCSQISRREHFCGFVNPYMLTDFIVFILVVLLLSRIAYRFLPICIDQKEE